MRRTLHPLMGLLCFLSACFGGLGGQSDTDEDGDKPFLRHKPSTNATEPELYNLTKDPHETKRLAKRFNKLLPGS